MIPGPRARARQWSRTAFGLAALFGSLPFASRIFLGSWGFEGAGDLAGLCAILGTYFHLAGRRFPRVPDEAAMLHRAIELASAGRVSKAMELCTRAVGLSPHFWQAYQCRGELHLAEGVPGRAVEDFTAALRLAPSEPHLYRLRAHAHALEGNQAAAASDLEAAAALEPPPAPQA